MKTRLLAAPGPAPFDETPIADSGYSGTLVCSASACSTPPMLPFSAS